MNKKLAVSDFCTTFAPVNTGISSVGRASNSPKPSVGSSSLSSRAKNKAVNS